MRYREVSLAVVVVASLKLFFLAGVSYAQDEDATATDDGTSLEETPRLDSPEEGDTTTPVEESPAEPAATEQTVSKKDGPRKKGKPQRYLQLNPFAFDWSKSQSKLDRGAAGGTVSAPGESTSFGVSKADWLELGLYGPGTYALVNVGPGFAYGLGGGIHTPWFEAGVEVDYTRNVDTTTAIVDGAEIETETKSSTYLLGVVGSYIVRSEKSRAKASARFGLIGSDASTNDDTTRDGSGWYLALGGEYSRPLRVLGPKTQSVHGAEYRYSVSKDEKALVFSRR